MTSSQRADASIACALLAGLTLLALAVEPERAGETADLGWRFSLAPDPRDRASTRRWVLSLPQPSAEAEDDKLLVLGAPRSEEPTTETPKIDLHDYALEAVRDGTALVPRLLLQRLPAALAAVESGTARKRLFIKALLPSLLAENERLLDRRARLINLFAAMDAGQTLLDPERLWLDAIADSYGADPGDRADLLRRVDAVPPSLAIAQAALESGWGSSRGAQLSHSMFGHMAFIGDAQRAGLRQFDNLAEAIAAYAHNLNTHRAYAQFRDARARQRSQSRPVDGQELAGELARYSQRGSLYIRDVRGLIRANGLDAFDHARLGG